jgi:hypothetical protein
MPVEPKRENQKKIGKQAAVQVWADEAGKDLLSRMIAYVV